jgi:hypothetical protein
MFITLLGYGINAELSDKDKAALVSNRYLPLPASINSIFVEFIYFPGYYVIASWKKSK